MRFPLQPLCKGYSYPTVDLTMYHVHIKKKVCVGLEKSGIKTVIF